MLLCEKVGQERKESEEMKRLTRVQRKKRRQKIFFRIILLIAILALVFALIFKSDFFLISNINVEGNYIITKEEIISRSGIDIGGHIFRYTRYESEEKIRKLSYIKDVTIKRDLPKSVNIFLEERQAYLQFNHLSSYILVDDEGFILEIKENKVRDLAIFKGFNIDKPTGDNILEEDVIKDLEAFIADEDTRDIVRKMNEIQYEDEDNINIILNNGINVAFGHLSNVKYKLILLNNIVSHIEENQIDTDTILMNKGENPIIITND